MNLWDEVDKIKKGYGYVRSAYAFICCICSLDIHRQ